MHTGNCNLLNKQSAEVTKAQRIKMNLKEYITALRMREEVRTKAEPKSITQHKLQELATLHDERDKLQAARKEAK